jgi:HEPN domain-containing protein
MIDIAKHIAHWMNGALEEIAVSRDLLEKNRTRHALFFAHLALEKALKAHVCRVTEDVPPRIHNLLRLAELAGLEFGEEESALLTEANLHNIEGRYPDTFSPEPSAEYAGKLIDRCESVVVWLKNQL